MLPTKKAILIVFNLILFYILWSNLILTEGFHFGCPKMEHNLITPIVASLLLTELILKLFGKNIFYVFLQSCLTFCLSFIIVGYVYFSIYDGYVNPDLKEETYYDEEKKIFVEIRYNRGWWCIGYREKMPFIYEKFKLYC